MGAPTVTYSFTNATTADATQVNQNFTDLINGVSDGTKDLSISALTVAGNASFSGTVTLGNASADDLTFNGSIASSIPIKTTATYNLGAATLGMAGVYFGANGYTTRIIGAAAQSATYSFYLPPADGTQDQYLVKGASSHIYKDFKDPDLLYNMGLAASVAGSALTIALKTAAGSDASVDDAVIVAFRDATLTSGVIANLKVTAALTTTISSGSTAGHVSALDGNLYIGLLNSAGTLELCWSTRPFDETALITTVAEGGAGAADSGASIYSTTQRTNVAVRIIGKMISNQATAGTWAAVPTNIVVGPSSKVLAPVPMAVQTKTTTYQILTTDETILCSGSAFTVTLPASSGLSGKTIQVTKTDSTRANIITIEGNAAETINGSANTALHTQYESVVMVCDGTNWTIIERKIPSKWESCTFTGAWTANTTYSAFRQRVGDSFNYDVKVALSGAPTSATLLLTLPTEDVIDSAKLATATQGRAVLSGHVSVIDAGASGGVGGVLYESTTQVRPIMMTAGGTYVDHAVITQAVPITFANTDVVVIKFSVPISGFNS